MIGINPVINGINGRLWICLVNIHMDEATEYHHEEGYRKKKKKMKKKERTLANRTNRSKQDLDKS